MTVKIRFNGENLKEKSYLELVNQNSFKKDTVGSNDHRFIHMGSWHYHKDSFTNQFCIFRDRVNFM